MALRGDNIGCGVSSTTATQINCASLTSGGYVDPYVLFASMGFVAGDVLPCRINLIEFTDGTFTSVKQFDSEAALFTLGASLATSYFTRQTILTAYDGTTYTDGGATGITPGTLANTIVEFGLSSSEAPSNTPWFDTASASGNVGLVPSNAYGGVSATFAVANSNYYWMIELDRPVVAAFGRAATGSATYTGTSNIYFRVYAPGTNGRPHKLLCDFGSLGTSGSALASVTTLIASSASSPAALKPLLLKPGKYIANLCVSFTGGSGAPNLRACNYLAPPIWGVAGYYNLPIFASASADTTPSPAPDPANTINWTLQTGPTFCPVVTIGPA